MTKPTAARQEKRNEAEEKKFKATSEEVLQELFHDMYRDRKKIYKVNFLRGVFFGFGSFLGATLLVALLIWILSLFVHLPVIGDYFQQAQQSIEGGKPR